MPNHKVEFDWDVLDAMLQFKVTLKFCADYLNVSTDAIQRRIKEVKGITFTEYHELRVQRTASKLQQKAIEMAIQGDRVLLIFCLKNLAGWSDKIETKEIEVTKEDTKLLIKEAQELVEKMQ
jgi:copper chaperone CopZ